jgi:hypothetical protein
LCVLVFSPLLFLFLAVTMFVAFVTLWLRLLPCQLSGATLGVVVGSMRMSAELGCLGGNRPVARAAERAWQSAGAEEDELVFIGRCTSVTQGERTG